jgi:hypothetical protein
MGYTTDFKSKFKITPNPSNDLKDYINIFSTTRRMGYQNLDKKYGLQGEFYIKGESYSGRGDIRPIDNNTPPVTQPGLWADWIIEGTRLAWNGSEKFYNYIEWLSYYINTFFAPDNYILSGQIYYKGEDPDDYGRIIVSDNIIYDFKHRIKKVQNVELDLVKQMLIGDNITIIKPKPRKTKINYKELLEEYNLNLTEN